MSAAPDDADRDSVASISVPESGPATFMPVLQTTLDIDKVIELFARELHQNVAFGRFSFEGNTARVAFGDATAGAHGCAYQLLIDKTRLGQVTVTRDYPFNEAEIARLETLIAALLYPLRNALLYQEARQGALKDPLTGLHNRAALNAALEHEIHVATREKTRLSLLMIDVDRFKTINDAYGHTTGDAVLLTLAECLRRCSRAADVIARFGGDEFCLLLRSIQTDGALTVPQRIQAHLAQAPVPHAAGPVRFTISQGIALLQGDDTPGRLVERADTALYQAKRRGGNVFVMCPESAASA